MRNRGDNLAVWTEDLGTPPSNRTGNVRWFTVKFMDQNVVVEMMPTVAAILTMLGESMVITCRFLANRKSKMVISIPLLRE